MEIGWCLVTNQSTGHTNLKSQFMHFNFFKLTPAIMMFFVCLACTRNAQDVGLSSGGDTTIVTPGNTWRITLFSERGDDETGDFAGYSFIFGSGNVLKVLKGSFSKTGTWNNTGSKFIIDVGPKTDANKPLGELTDDWQIISVSASEIKLTDDNATSGEFLTFVRN